MLITPNLDEVAALTGRAVSNVEDMEEAALQIHGMGARNVLIKGGHAGGPDAVDVFFDGSAFVLSGGPGSMRIIRTERDVFCPLRLPRTWHRAGSWKRRCVWGKIL